ncbi:MULTISPECIES: WhiB family transcriptional regulator [Streptomyces]|jgi:WhiB family redox-sensing transcriptional regulator|uniref:WhiB family transcriptional regulator n=1 Tax=Streptomyces TaxID=1883 RepID=UPI000A363E46|nr:WhiB family transcriptional regulator [Streptomyces glaucescens]
MADDHRHAAVPDWRDQAACLGEDPEIFFPLSDTLAPGAEARPALAVCRRCRVLLACRSWAVEHGEDAGIWGATTAAQRRAVRRATNGEPQPAYRKRGAPAGGDDRPEAGP